MERLPWYLHLHLSGLTSGIQSTLSHAMTPKVFIRYPENGLYYCRVAVRGKRHMFCTKTDDIKIARLRAKDYRDALVAKEYGLATGMKANTPCATFQELYDAYLTLPVPANPESRRQNWRSLLQVIGASGLTAADRVDRLNRNVALKWQISRLGVAMGTPSGTKGLESSAMGTGGAITGRHGQTVSCNTRLRQARAMFSRHALAFYNDDLALPMERIRDFLSTPAMPLTAQRIRPLPDPAAMLRAEDRLTGLPQHKPEWCAYLLAKYGGMRPKEIIAARWDWLQGGVLTIGGQDGVAATKTGRFRAIRLSPDVVAELLAAKTDDTYLVGPSPTRTVRQNLVTMLRAYGFTMGDPIYSLRRWHASWRYENQGVPQAQESMGHTSPTMTMRHYARMVSAPPPIPFDNPAPNTIYADSGRGVGDADPQGL